MRARYAHLVVVHVGNEQGAVITCEGEGDGVVKRSPRARAVDVAKLATTRDG